jgi:hypothetical protein
MLDRASNPTRYRTVVLSGAPTDLLERLGGEANRDKFAQLRPSATWWTLGLLVLRLGVELVLFLPGHLLRRHRSSRYRLARWSAAA